MRGTRAVPRSRNVTLGCNVPPSDGWMYGCDLAQAEVVVGNEWRLEVDLPSVSFGVERPVREEMVDDINRALDKDVEYQLPDNYLRGEGDSEYNPRAHRHMHTHAHSTHTHTPKDL